MPMMTKSYEVEKQAAIAEARTSAFVPADVPAEDVPHAAQNCTPAEFRERVTGAVVQALSLNGALPNYLALRQWTDDAIKGWDAASGTASLAGALLSHGDMVVRDADDFRVVAAADFASAYEMVCPETDVELSDLTHAAGPDPAALEP